MFRSSRWLIGCTLLSIAIVLALGIAGCNPKPKVENTTSTEVVKEEKGFTLMLSSTATGASLSCTLSLGLKKDEDHVRWFNQTTGAVTIQLTSLTPFLETEKSFTVQPNEFSPYYSLNLHTQKGGYDYTTTPALLNGGPTQPTITVGD